MKKIFNAIIFAACVFTAASFTSCSKDNDGFIDDGGEVIGGGGSDNPGQGNNGYDYFAPYTTKGGSKDDVKKYMEGLPGWTLVQEDRNTSSFTKAYPRTGVVYYFNYEGKVFNAIVTYSDASKFEDLKARLEEDYHCTFEKTVDGSILEIYQAENAMFNERKGHIAISVTRTTVSSTITVNYSF